VKPKYSVNLENRNTIALYKNNVGERWVSQVIYGIYFGMHSKKLLDNFSQEF
jgi:hypothetical protein